MTVAQEITLTNEELNARAARLGMPIGGVNVITGEHDTGKTTFGMEAIIDPGRLLMVDDDVKGAATIKQIRESGIEFGKYINLVEVGKGKNELQFHAACMEIIDGIQPNQYDALMWDTWTRFQKSLHPYVMANPKEFREKWSPMGTIKGAEQWIEAERYEAQILNDLQAKVPLVLLVVHTKDQYSGNVKTGKKIPAHGKALNRVSQMRIWLMHNPASPVPLGLVLKRPDRKVKTERGLRTISVLPRKITPRPGDASLWDTILWYYDNPVGNRAPTPDETPNDFELSILDGTLTQEQKLVLAAYLKGSKEDEVESAEMLLAVKKRALELNTEGMPPPAIVANLQSEIEEGMLVANVDDITVPVVAGWLAEGT